MPFSGAGVFSRIHNFVADKAAALNIIASRMDAELDGIATGLSNTITCDGQSTITEPIPFNSQRLTGLGTATADTDAMNRITADGRYLMTASGTQSVTTTGTGSFGKVRIGTVDAIEAVAGEKLHVKGTATFVGASAGLVGAITPDETGAGALIVGNVSNHAIRIIVNNAEVGRFTTTGTFQMGGTTALGKIGILQNANTYAQGFGIGNVVGNTWQMVTATSNALYFGYNNVDKAFVDNVTGAYSAVSDRDVKKAIAPIPTTRAKQSIMALEPVSYLMKEQEPGARRNLGFIAQDAQVHVPEGVTAPSEPGRAWAMQPAALIPLLVAHVKDLETRLAALEGNP